MRPGKEICVDNDIDPCLNVSVSVVTVRESLVAMHALKSLVMNSKFMLL